MPGFKVFKSNFLQLDLMNHLDSWMEAFGIALATVGITRDVSELLTAEARDLLKGTSLISGDFETVFTGVYGDDVQVSGFAFVVFI